MTNITIYDANAKKIEKIAKDNCLDVYEVVDMLCDFLDDMKRDEYLK